MLKNYPYVGSHYFSENFKPQDLTISFEKIFKSESRHCCNEAVFIFVCSGEATIEINGVLFPIKEGNLVHLLPYHVHRLILKKEERIELFRISFSLGLLLLSSVNEKNYLSSIRNLDYIVPIIHLNSRKQKQLLFFCQEVLYEKQQLHSHFESLHLSLISFISYLLQTSKMNPIKKEQATIGWQCLEYLQLHHQDSLTIELVEKELAIPKLTIKESLKNLTGFSFSQLLNQVRIRNATALLQFPELTVQQIASICGYDSNANFYKQFQETHQITPTAYRKKLSESNQLIAYTDAWDIAIYLLENCCSTLTLETIAQHTNFSTDKINYLLKEKFDSSFKEMLNFFRIQVGRHLLLNFDYKVAEVALKVGFSDSNTFIRNYKKVYMTTPHQDKKNLAK